MSKLIINWWKPLFGTVTPVPNKNSIIKLIPACVLTEEPVTLHNVPKTSDVKYMLQIMESLGGSYEWISDSSVRIDASWVNSYEIDYELSQKMKASVMYTGPLLTRFGRVSMPFPQWCKLGTRPMDSFMEAMGQLWVEYEYHDGSYDLVAKNLQWKDIRQWFPSVTGTENLVLLAVMTPWTTTVTNAWCEPHTQDLCNMLVSMGAKIRGIGSNKLTIEWVTRLLGTERTVISDHLDVGWMIAASVMTKWSITIENAIIPHMHGIIQAFQKLGVTVELDHENDRIIVPQEQDLRISTKVKGTPFDLKALQRPLYPADLIHVAVVLGLKSDGQAIFHNLMYEYGFFFVQELAKMKANVIMWNPSMLMTTGPTVFKPANLVCSDIIQASYGLLLAWLSAEWTTTLNAITPLFRRFPNFVEQFNRLGADIVLED